MIIYVMNQVFPHSSGFGRRCMREIQALSSLEDIVVLCREDYKSENNLTLQNGKLIKLVKFGASSEIVHDPKDYKSNGFYEIKRNLDLMFGLLGGLLKIAVTYKRERLHFYSVTSPLTVPLFTLVIAKIFGSEATLVSFHDLEPELALHMKNIGNNSWLYKVEIWLEKLMCISYRKVLVTSKAQSDIIIKRTNIPATKISFIPNSTDLKTEYKKDEKKLPNFKKSDTKLVYMSSFTFDYTVSGFLEFLETFSLRKEELPSLKIIVIGGGEGLYKIQSFIRSHNLASEVFCLGPLNNPAHILKEADLAIIPWKQDRMTSTMLPTKLFEYMSFGLPIIAPNFGEFENILKDGENALLSTENSMLDEVKKLIANSNLSHKLGKNGLDLYNKHYRPEILDQKLISFYKQT